MRLTFLAFFSCLAFSLLAQGEKTKYQVSVVGFYNLENFYDTIDDPNKNDEEFLPNGSHNYNTSIYYHKINNLATVLSQIGTQLNPEGWAFMGVAEIENDTVLTDLLANRLLKDRKLKFVHYNSPDLRGVDVGLLYNPKYFTVLDSKPLFVQLPGGSKDAYFTRDVLWVKGKLGGEVVHVYVNHWPSRLGGEVRSAPARAAAAMVSKHHMDSIAQADGEQKVFIMGDLNDDPISPSLTKVLGAKGSIADVKPGGLYNPWVELYKRGIGTLAYQDAWGLFDQILLSYKLVEKEQKGYFFYKQYIFNPEYMVENIGRYKGYPMRTWDGSAYRGGYSDHFPTYVALIKKMESK
jgi:hypothetical protein